ncbi:MAG: sugar ABC transporter permease [Chloroflexota bacterium]|jgi:multiple sugar transport system permease protein|nr:sugar ABC transporter permease [Chloroflexota bacterium]
MAMSIPGAASKVGKRKPMSALRRKEAMYGYIAILPWFIGFLIFTAGPMVFSAYLVFTEWELLTPPVWVGLDNFRFLLEDQMFRTTLWNTFLYTIVSVPLQLLLALGVALLLNLNIRGTNLYRAIIFLPSQTPVVASALLWFFIFSPTQGLANAAIGLFGIPPQTWLWDIDLVKPALIAVAVWAFGTAMIIFLAGLQDIPQSLYEAAELDGAGPISKLVNVTLPLLTPTIFFNLVIGLIGAFQVFTPVYLMTGGGPGNASMMMGLLIYREGFEEFNMGYASLLAWVLFMIIITLTIIQFSVAKRWVYYEGDKA